MSEYIHLLTYIHHLKAFTLLDLMPYVYEANWVNFGSSVIFWLHWLFTLLGPLAVFPLCILLHIKSRSCGFSAQFFILFRIKVWDLWAAVCSCKIMSSTACLDLALKHAHLSLYVYLMTARYILSLGWLWTISLSTWHHVKSDYITRVSILLNAWRIFCKAFAFIPLISNLEVKESFEEMKLSFECVSERKSKLIVLPV